MRLLGVASQEGVLALKLLDEAALNRVNLFARSVVDEWLFSLRIRKHLEPSLHLPVAPTLPHTFVSWHAMPLCHHVSMTMTMNLNFKDGDRDVNVLRE